MTLWNFYASSRLPRTSRRCFRTRPLTIERLEARCLLSYKVTELGPATVNLVAYGINNAGQVAGKWDNNGFLWDHGVVTNLGSLPGGMYSLAWAINNLGQVVGYADSPVSYARAFVWDQGVMSELGTLGGLRSFAWGINDAEQVVGGSDLTNQFNGPAHAFRWDRGTMTDLGTLGGSSSVAYGINDAGDVVGDSQGLDFSTHAFLYHDGIMTDLGAPNQHTATGANAINNAGQVVGTADFLLPPEDDYQHALLWQDGTLTDLGTLGGPTSRAWAINDAGDVVGETQLSGGPPYRQVAFLYHDGVMTDLNTLLAPGSGWTTHAATGINDAGQIIADAVGPDHFEYAVLLTPTRDPPQAQPLPGPLPVQALGGPLVLGGLGNPATPADAQPSPVLPTTDLAAGQGPGSQAPASIAAALVATLSRRGTDGQAVDWLHDPAVSVEAFMGNEDSRG